MKVFFDTSSLLKKYVIEPGYQELDQILAEVEIIIVAPTFLLEAHSAVDRFNREKKVSNQEKSTLKSFIKKDLRSFEQIIFNQQLHDNALDLIDRYPLTTLDAIQLSSAIIAQPDIFVTSDKQLFKYSQHELKKVKLI